MEAKFNSVLQIGLVVDDLDAYLRRYENDFGITPWEILEFGPDTIPGLMLDGKPSTLRLRCAFHRSFQVDLELIQPLSEGWHMDWLRKHGPGLNHVAMLPAESYEKFMEEYTKTGGRPSIEGLNKEKTTGFAYLDLIRELGFVLEVNKGERK